MVLECLNRKAFSVDGSVVQLPIKLLLRFSCEYLLQPKNHIVTHCSQKICFFTLAHIAVVAFITLIPITCFMAAVSRAGLQY